MHDSASRSASTTVGLDSVDIEADAALPHTGAADATHLDFRAALAGDRYKHVQHRAAPIDGLEYHIVHH